MAKAPAFQFYAADFLTGTALLSDADVGQYIRLLSHEWVLGPLPNDNPSLSRLLGGSPISDAVREKFVLNNEGRLINERLESERAKQAEYREKQAENGKKGGRPRVGEKPNETQAITQKKPKPNPSHNPTPKPNHNPNESSSSSSSSSSSVLDLQSSISTSEKDSAGAAADAVPKVAKSTWLTPFNEIWKRCFGGDMAFAKESKPLKKLNDTHGDLETLQRWRHYCEAHEGEGQYASAATFAKTFGQWDGSGRNGKKPANLFRGLQQFVEEAESRKAMTP